MLEHRYQLSIKWSGNTGQGTTTYCSYERSHIISSPGKPDLFGSSDPLFRGDPSQYNPEELLLASLSACHMLWYLHLCSENQIVVTAYVDNPCAIMVIEPSGSGYFQEVTLYPKIRITELKQQDTAKDLHLLAHKKCFIANSVNFPVRIEALIEHRVCVSEKETFLNNSISKGPA